MPSLLGLGCTFLSGYPSGFVDKQHGLITLLLIPTEQAFIAMECSKFSERKWRARDWSYGANKRCGNSDCEGVAPRAGRSPQMPEQYQMLLGL
jgi:hypothetical protein